MLLSIYQHTSTQRYLLPLPTTACAPLHTRDMLVLRSKRFALRAKRVHHARARHGAPRAPRALAPPTGLAYQVREAAVYREICLLRATGWPGIPGQRGCCLAKPHRGRWPPRNLPLACNWICSGKSMHYQRLLATSPLRDSVYHSVRFITHQSFAFY